VDHIGSYFRFEEICLHGDDREVFALHSDPGYIRGELARYALPPRAARLSPAARLLMTPKAAGKYRYIRYLV